MGRGLGERPQPDEGQGHVGDEIIVGGAFRPARVVVFGEGRGRGRHRATQGEKGGRDLLDDVDHRRGGPGFGDQGNDRIEDRRLVDADRSVVDDE